jgi:hypothetical protein
MAKRSYECETTENRDESRLEGSMSVAEGNRHVISIFWKAIDHGLSARAYPVRQLWQIRKAKGFAKASGCASQRQEQLLGSMSPCLRRSEWLVHLPVACTVLSCRGCRVQMKSLKCFSGSGKER